MCTQIKHISEVLLSSKISWVINISPGVKQDTMAWLEHCETCKTWVIYLWENDVLFSLSLHSHIKIWLHLPTDVFIIEKNTIHRFTWSLSLLQAITIEGQDSIFGSENSVATNQNSSQAQLPEPGNKLDDSIDNQQQVCLASWPVPSL